MSAFHDTENKEILKTAVTSLQRMFVDNVCTLEWCMKDNSNNLCCAPTDTSRAHIDYFDSTACITVAVMSRT
eukprot:m.136404 g.136404  ORF g.136404 m.136404 type:complete len:72 (+) comp17571_c0_seq37:1487-1702(+)